MFDVEDDCGEPLRKGTCSNCGVVWCSVRIHVHKYTVRFYSLAPIRTLCGPNYPRFDYASLCVPSMRIVGYVEVCDWSRYSSSQVRISSLCRITIQINTVLRADVDIECELVTRPLLGWRETGPQGKSSRFVSNRQRLQSFDPLSVLDPASGLLLPFLHRSPSALARGLEST